MPKNDLVTNDRIAVNQDLQGIDAIIAVPTSKLDADQYAAEDLDGVTESVFGSGNLNFLSLQSGQTDEMMMNEDSFSLGEIANQFDPSVGTDTDRALSVPEEASGENFAAQNNFSNTTMGSVAASVISSGSKSFAIGIPGKSGLLFSDIDYSDNKSSRNSSISSETRTQGRDGNNGNNGDGNSGTNGNDGNDGIDGQDGLSPVGGINISLVTDILDTLGTSLGLNIGDGIQGHLDVVGMTDNLNGIVNDLTGLAGPLPGIGGLTTDFDLFRPDANEMEPDLQIVGVPLPGIYLNSVEQLVGDLDIKLDLAQLTDPSGIVNNLGTTLHSLNNFQLASPQEILNVVGAQNIDGAVKVLIGNAGLDEVIDVSVNDILNDVSSLLGQVPVLDQVVDGLNGLPGVILPGNALGGIGDLASDIVENLGVGVQPLEDVIAQVGDLVQNPDLSSVLEQVTDGLGNLPGLDVLDNLGGGLGPLQDVIAQVGGIFETPDPEQALGIIGDITGGVPDLIGGSVGGLLDALDIGGSGGGNGDGDIGLGGYDLGIDIVEDLTGDVDLGLNPVLDLFDSTGTDNQSGDTDLIINSDLDITNNDLLDGGLDVALDPVEALVGDVDVDLSVATNILGDIADPLVNDATGGSGDDNLLSGVGDILSDVVGGVTDPILGGGDIFDDAIIYDPVENLTGQIETDMADALDLLTQQGDIILPDASDIDAWTETVSDVGGGMFGDILNGLGGEADMLPDPVGTIAEGLGALHVDPTPIIIKIGGLFGH